MDNIDYDSLIPDIEKTKLKKIKNDIYLSDAWIEILERYDIDYRKYNSISALIFDIEEILNSGVEANELEELSRDIQEFNYYNNTNK
ncbi:unknown [Clostridium sp. CAG:710]|jgi:hypothetical protein|nr:unknown [Clostridium sp. CAG:710]